MKSQKVIHILVIDSFFAAAIAENLTDYYRKRHPEIEVTCHLDKCPEGVRVDILVLSASNVLGNDDYVLNLKRDKRYETTKVLIVAMTYSYLIATRELSSLGANFILPKQCLLNRVIEAEMSKQEAEHILDSLLTSAIASSNERKSITHSA